MLQLNLPHAELRITRKGERLFVWDYIRMRWVVLTPEEWVRQHFSHWMTDCLGYPQGRLGHEISLRINGMARRSDAVFYDTEGSPLIIMEFKSPQVAISQHTFDQICRYNRTMQVPYLIISNGLSHFCCHVLPDSITYLPAIPSFDSLPSTRVGH